MLSSVVLLLIALTLGQSAFVYQSGVTFTGNVTLAKPDSRFDYKATTALEIPGFGFWFKNMNVSASTTSNSASANVDGVIALGYAGLLLYPSSYAAYFEAAGSLSFSGNNVNFDASASGALVGKVFTSLQEIDSKGGVVKDYSLQGVPIIGTSWTVGSLKVVDAERGLRSLTATTKSIGTATVAITFVFASVMGKVTGGATLTPTAVETYFEVDGYTLADPQNKLRLNLYTGYLTASASVVGSGTIVAGSGNSQIYIRFDRTASINGENREVTVTGLDQAAVSVNDIPDATIKGQLKAHGNLVAEVRKVAVDFPAGVSSFTYDPAIGFGAPNAGSFLAPSVLVLLLAALFALFF